jgi:carboxypeptidase T
MCRMKIRVLALAVILAALQALLPAAEDGRVISVAKADFDAAGLGRRGLDRLMEKNGRIFIVASPGELAALAALRVGFAIETERFLPLAGPASTADGGINGAYHSALELETDLRTLERDHAGLARVVEIGESLEKRKIYALCISDNALIDENEPAILFLGCHHAREWISVEVPYLFGKYLLEHYASDPEIRSLVEASEIWIVPCVNPDGLEYSIHVYRYWRKNRRANADGTYGVDINRNYGYRWGADEIGSSGEPASEIYRGKGPFSEPETAAVRGLVAGRELRAMISFHSYSQTILFPWGYTTTPAPRDAELNALAGAMTGLIAAVNGRTYVYGQASRVLYVTNGDTVDWAYSLAGAPSFTIELPPVDVDQGGFFNDEEAIAGIFEENRPAMLYLTRYGIDHPLPLGKRRTLRGDRIRTPIPGKLETAARTP